MYIVRGNIRWCKSLKQVACAVSKTPLYKEISLSSRHADSTESEEPFFGLLSSDPKSKLYEKKKINDASLTRSPPLTRKGQGQFKQAEAVPDSTSEFNQGGRFPKYSSRNARVKTSTPEGNEPVFTPGSDHHENFKLTDSLEKWHGFKSSENEKVQRLSQNIVEDDDEDEFHYYLHKPQTKKKTFNDRKKGLGLHHQSTETETVSFTQDLADEPFGTLTPRKDLYEDESGDEGDEMQRKYEEAQLERRHSPVYYGNQMKKLCKEKRLADALKILKEEMPAVNAKQMFTAIKY
ncbi:uncharacterized protein LOC135206673 [Macrobrachium nipponense]|uniref:uncharacterized protein LOC135206673 n=1 Tax=Macrobrachium nipponense TaxID=159736 RepID=UPI0030C83EFC